MLNRYIQRCGYLDEYSKLCNATIISWPHSLNTTTVYNETLRSLPWQSFCQPRGSNPWPARRECHSLTSVKFASLRGAPLLLPTLGDTSEQDVHRCHQCNATIFSWLHSTRSLHVTRHEKLIQTRKGLASTGVRTRGPAMHSLTSLPNRYSTGRGSCVGPHLLSRRTTWFTWSAGVPRQLLVNKTWVKRMRCHGDKRGENWQLLPSSN